MDLFTRCPKVRKCCFCFSLKSGCVIIAIVDMIFTFRAVFDVFAPDPCQPVTPFQKGVYWFVISVGSFLGFTMGTIGLIFLVGINNPSVKLGKFYMMMMLVRITYSLFTTILIPSAFHGQEGCGYELYYLLPLATVHIWLYVYFIMVINTFIETPTVGDASRPAGNGGRTASQQASTQKL